MNAKTWLGALALVSTVAAAVAAVPEGKGTVGLGAGLGIGQTLEDGGGVTYKSGTSLQGMLEGDAPLWEGLSLGLRATAGNAPYTLTSGSNEIDENVADYFFGAQLTIHPAAFLGKAYQPGLNANPDGWLLWPSLTLQYSSSKQNDIVAISHPGNNASTALFVDFQDFGYGLTLPLAPWLSLNGGYLRNSQFQVDYTALGGPADTLLTGGSYEGEWAGLATYIDLIPGAGADTTRPFVPHLGRLGQLRAAFTWNRVIDLPIFGGSVSGVQTYALDLGAPLSGSLGLSLNVTHLESDAPLGGVLAALVGHQATESRDAMSYNLAVTWAFGDPGKRVD